MFGFCFRSCVMVVRWINVVILVIVYIWVFVVEKVEIVVLEVGGIAICL